MEYDERGYVPCVRCAAVDMCLMTLSSLPRALINIRQADISFGDAPLHCDVTGYKVSLKLLTRSSAVAVIADRTADIPHPV